jgi:hypothetical protein
MPLPVVNVRYVQPADAEEDTFIHCPFSGAPAEGPEGACLSPTVFFVDYGVGIVETNSTLVRDLLDRCRGRTYPVNYLIKHLNLPGAFVLRVDHDWNGIFSYGFSLLPVP